MWICIYGYVKNKAYMTGQRAPGDDFPGPAGRTLAPQALRWPIHWPTPEMRCFSHRAYALFIQTRNERAEGNR